MSRISRDQLKHGVVENGFDYNLQVWVIKGIVQDCGHPESMQSDGPCCNKHLFSGQRIVDIPGHEIRT